MNFGPLFFLDFETNKAGDFYLVGLSANEKFEQIVLTEKLDGLAEQFCFATSKPKEFASAFLRNVSSQGGTIVAYSIAEQEILRSLFPAGDPIYKNVSYCNLLKSARSWIRKYKTVEFDALPPLVKGANAYSKRRHPKSLASICRLINFNAPSDYAIGKTTSRFNTVVDALKKRNGDYSSLTPVQKGKATKAIKHNRYDVESMKLLFDEIQKTDQQLNRKATVSLFENVT
jgi:hypothetical protein